MKHGKSMHEELQVFVICIRMNANVFLWHLGMENTQYIQTGQSGWTRL
jgi:hypothetical protein